MQQTRYEMIVRAQDPISHGQQNLGNAQIFMRKKVRLPGGATVLCPYLTGDTIRHQLRAAATWGTLQAAGLLDEPQFSEGAVRLLFNGGSLTGRGNASVVNLERYRELVALFPPLALLGGNADNRPLQGQVNVDEGNLLCRELAHVTPPWVLQWAESNGESIDTHRSLIEETQRVRMDATLAPETAKLLSDGARATLDARLLKAEKAHADADSKAAGEAKSGMMPRTHERIVQGALLWLGVEARTYTDLEFDAFNFSVACLLNNFRVGGKLGSGHGRLQFVAGARIAFEPTAGKLEQVSADLAPKTGELYRQHIEFRKEELAAWLRSAVNA